MLWLSIPMATYDFVYNYKIPFVDALPLTNSFAEKYIHCHRISLHMIHIQYMGSHHLLAALSQMPFLDGHHRTLSSRQ